MLKLLNRSASALVTPSVFDFWARELGSTLTWNQPLARITAIRPEAEDSVSLELRPNHHFNGFRPGQHVNFSAEIDGVRETRSYSLTGLPGTRRLSITVQRVPGGRLSNWLCDSARVGDVLQIDQAFGELLLPDPLPAAGITLLAGGSGITPLMSLTRALAAQDFPVPLRLQVWAKHAGRLCFHDELQALAAAHANFHYQYELTHAGGQRPCAANLPNVQDQLLICCGPGGFVASLRRQLAEQAGSLLAEAFTAVRPTTASSGATVTATLTRSGQQLQIPSDRPILQALEAQGLQPEHGCRQGICQRCSCAKATGQTRNLHNDLLQDQPDSALRICMHAATSDISLDL